MRKESSFRYSALVFLTLTAVLAFSSKGVAGDLKINVQEVKVYKEADPSSEVITTLMRGDNVKVSNKNPPGFQKVLIQSGGANQIGYIKNQDLMVRGAPAARPGQPQQPGRRVVARSLRNRWGVALIGGINYQSQGSRTSTEASGAVDNYGTMGGIGTRFGLGLQFPISTKFSGFGYAEMKNVSVSGTGSQIPAGQTTATPQDIFLKETFYCGGLAAQYYFSNAFWAGAGFEYDYNSSGTLKVGSQAEAPLDALNLVSFFYVYASAGYNFALSNKLYLTTDMRIGTLLSRPLIIEGDFGLRFTYAF